MRRPDAARLALGTLALARPDTLTRWSRCERSEARNHDAHVRLVVRVLGARYVVQSLGGRWLHRAWVPEADAAVDLVHAASMVALAAVAPRHRRLALASAAAATAFAVADATPILRPGAPPAAGGD